jgi:hypothetical protein
MKQAAWRTRNPARNVLREGTIVKVVPTLKLSEPVAGVAVPTSMDFRQKFRLHERPLPSLSDPIIESSNNSTTERESKLECRGCVQLGEKRLQVLT